MSTAANVDPTLAKLLEGLPESEDLKDPRAGDHEDAKLTEVTIAQNKEGAPSAFSFVEKWSGMKTEKEKKDFDMEEYVNCPESGSPDWVKRMFRDHLKVLGILDRSAERTPLANEDGQRQQLLALLRKVVGQKFPVTVGERNGFVHLRVRRRRA